MVDTAGTKLRRARKLRQISLEDASRATKIRASQLADLESDDYSNFANLAYAKSFLVGYSKYLHVDVRSYLDVFADASTFGLDDYQYLSETPVGSYRAPTRQQIRRKPQRRQFVVSAMALGFLAIFGVIWLLAAKVQQLGDLDKLAAHLDAREHASTHAETEAVNQPPAAAAPAQAPAVIVPVSVPALAPADATTPTPSVAPLDDTVRVTAGALAAADPSLLPTGNPMLPTLGDGNAVREMLQPMPRPPVAALTAGHPADAVHRDVSQPQKVVNNRPR